MSQNEATTILEALASGVSPSTGEMIENDSVLNDSSVMRALQVAIDQLKKDVPQASSEVQISDEHINAALEIYIALKRKPTNKSLAGFFHGTRKFKDDVFLKHPLYGKYKNVYKKGPLLDFFADYLKSNEILKKIDLQINPFRTIDYFQGPKFNTLTEPAIEQLKDKIGALGVLRTENLAENVVNARKKHPRAYESWTEKEKDLLSQAILYTNDLDLLSSCFQRGVGSIESCGQRIIYEASRS